MAIWKSTVFFLISLRLPGEISGFFTGYVHVYTKFWYTAGTWWCRYRLQVSSRFPRFSSAHKNLVRKVQALLRPVLESPAHRLSNGIPCWLVSSSLLLNYKKWKSPYILYGSGPDPSGKIYMQIWDKKIRIEKIENVGCTQNSILEIACTTLPQFSCAVTYSR